MTAKEIEQILKGLGDPERAAHSTRYFKTGRGEYGEGDQFLGIRMPVIRAEVKQHKELPLRETVKLLRSPLHEVRMFALLLLALKFRKADQPGKTRIYSLYLENTKYINNWDLVDCSAHLIVGPYLQDKDRQPLYTLAKSSSLWERRIAMFSNYHFIRQNDFDDALKIAKILINDKEDLIHKVVGWMLREIGNRDKQAEDKFLQRHYQSMPRTMLRYAIEKYPEAERQQYLKGLI